MLTETTSAAAEWRSKFVSSGTVTTEISRDVRRRCEKDRKTQIYQVKIDAVIGRFSWLFGLMWM